ncbi:xylosyltransferase 2 [Corythoichthys intestinalis]|uniref:xylosyltransferase 2 n=1 Tax=Corythoichthys intestinalis TaxID=161448 RepID=UPI0025A5DFCB|nr:xylosyltransferase 2 [Corythoichthys intestinalis]XP_061805209.1 xylosyltransferase 2-like [Nerophis lumbriciformis]
MVATARVRKLLRRYKLAIAVAFMILLVQALVVWSLKSLEDSETGKKTRRSKLPDNSQDLLNDATIFARHSQWPKSYRGLWSSRLERKGDTATSAPRLGTSQLQGKPGIIPKNPLEQGQTGTALDGGAPHDPSSNLNDIKGGGAAFPGDPGSVDGAQQASGIGFEPKCTIMNKDAWSALRRAVTNQCRQEIADIVCLHEAGVLLPHALPRFCPPINSSSPEEALDVELDNSLADEENPVRIAFVIMVHGRAVRQVKRILKAIYHSDHFYYIHVDQRSDYMHREVLKIAEQYPNVRVTPWRMVTIWGGVGLLKAYLRVMEDFVAMPDVKWDFFINLSGTDFPTRTIGELVDFLGPYKGKNFLKAHGREVSRFINRQGIDRLFYECDNHMWRVGVRNIPEGIEISGGSDWFALSHQFVDYIATSEDDLVSGLKLFYSYTLLPAESFFHTLLLNSHLCHTFIDNNLRATNWIRKLGCKCQYRHIVDWCGCSPNDYKPRELMRIHQMSRPTFFARKFESLVNQEAMEIMDTHLYGQYAPGTVAVKAYWENKYEQLDGLHSLTDVALTAYTSLIRLGLKNLATSQQTCWFEPIGYPSSVYLYFYDDHFKGYLIQQEVQTGGSKEKESIQIWAAPQVKLKIERYLPEFERLRNVQVSTEWDPKERILRNFGGIIGPFDEPYSVQHWGRGTNMTVTMVWIDPALVVAASYDVKVDTEAEFTLHKPPLKRPLRPGIWSLRVLKQWEQMAEFQFLVIPLNFKKKEPLKEEDSLAVHSGPSGNFYTDQSFDHLSSILQLPPQEPAMLEAQQNAKLVGPALEAWIDGSVETLWVVNEMCATEKSSCAALPLCSKTSWSSLSPDPKSELGPVKSDGRIR